MMKAVTAARLGLRLGGAGRWDWWPLLGPVAVLAVGFLLTVALSFPAVLVPGTRVGAMLAGALIAGALAGRGRSPRARAASGALMGLLLGAALSVAAWGLLSDAADAALWQVTGVNIVANSNIRPVDAGLGSWLGGDDQFENACCTSGSPHPASFWASWGAWREGCWHQGNRAAALMRRRSKKGAQPTSLLPTPQKRRKTPAKALRTRRLRKRWKNQAETRKTCRRMMTEFNGMEKVATTGEDQESTVTTGEDQESTVTTGEDQESTVTTGEDRKAP